MAVTRNADHLHTSRIKRHRYQRPRRAQARTYPVEDSDESTDDVDQSRDSDDQDVPDLETDSGINTGDELSAPGATSLERSPLRRSVRKSAIAVAPKTRLPKSSKPPQHLIGRPNPSPRKSKPPSIERPVSKPLGRPANNSVSPLKRRREHTEPPRTCPGVIPNWLSPAIPYAAWVDVFTYAASEGTTDNLSSGWLKHAATTCRAFAEPALAALYYRPAIKSATKARHLVAILEKDPTTTLINYRSKVQSLFLDTSTIPQPNFHQLISPLPWLKELIIFHPFDQPPYRSLDKTVRWSYPPEIFRALEAAPTGDNAVFKPTGAVLRSWEWSARLLNCPITELARLHQTLAFAGLTRLSLTNFQVPSLNQPPPKEDDAAAALAQELADGAVIEAVANAISELKSLKHLVFESSTVMNDKLLPLLPRGLTQLDLINCWEIKSEDLTAFLRTHGYELKVLNLMHNQSLNLAFLTDLSDTCPNLHELRMNLSYYRHHESVDDGDPMYDTALNPGQTPQWPGSLRLIDFEHIRDWSSEAANDFLQSLVDQAEILPDLRHLVIKTILDIPWQARATMRQEWRRKMDKVFLRPYQPPLHRTSLRPTTLAPHDTTAEDSASPRKRQRRSSPPSRRSGRLAEQDSQRDEVDDGIEVPFVQGKCKTVSITFDNQKVRELQYGMEDFLMSDDDESEEEWTGDYDDDDAVIAF